MFHSMVEESREYVAYQCMNSKTFRQSLTIPYPLWKELEPDIQKVIQVARECIQPQLVPDTHATRNQHDTPRNTPTEDT